MKNNLRSREQLLESRLMPMAEFGEVARTIVRKPKKDVEQAMADSKVANGERRKVKKSKGPA